MGILALYDKTIVGFKPLSLYWSPIVQIMNHFNKLMFSIFLLCLVKGEVLAQQDFSGANVKSSCKKCSAFEKDKQNGIIKVYKAGAHSFSKTYQRLLLRQYKIELIETDLFVIDDSMLCYNKFSLPFIYKKHGKSVFTETQAAANKLDRTGKGDAYTKFKPNQEDLIRNFMYERIDPAIYEEFLQSDRKELGLYCYLQVDKTGKIYKSYGAGLKGSSIDSVIDTVAQQVPYKLIPALSDGSPTKGRIALKLTFTEDTKRQYLASELRK